MIKKWFKTYMNQNDSIQEQMFCMLSGIGLAALLFLSVYCVVTSDSIINVLMLVASFVVVYTVTALSLRKHKVNTGASLISILLFILFYINFFTSGGIYGGAPLWIVFCSVYISLVVYGRRKFVFLGIFMVMTVACYYIGYNYPKYLAQNTKETAYIDSAMAVLIIGALISATILLQNHIFMEKNRISKEQKAEIEELNKAEQRFFSSMSHEIRTPINTIIGLNEMILRDNVSNEVAENARNIQGASKMLLTLINDILDLSKMQSGKMDIVNVSYETGMFFSDIINMIWIKAKQKGLEFHLDIDSSIPSMLYGDEVRIKQVLINILNNSVKYTDKGSVTLSVRCERLSVNRVRVYYNIADTGMGIKKESIPFLFDAFQRVDEKKNRYIEGTGLGLSIVKQLLDLMGGQITVNSVYTKGSTFLVALEQEIVDGKELGTFTLDSRIDTKQKAQYKESFTAPEAHILIVDDNEMNLAVATKLLSDTKVQIDTASSGAECLKLTLLQHYDAILMDHLMPGMDGVECLHELRVQKGGMCHDVPVIALTANAGSDSQLLYKKEGFSGYIAKPVSGMLLEAAILNILPDELVMTREGEVDTEIGKEVLMFDHRQRVELMVTTDSMCDLPKEIIEKYGISVCPYYVCTEEGRFLDEKEICADDLLVYLEAGKKGYSHQPEVTDYEKFFADKLSGAQNVIHITMAKTVSEAYRSASEAAEAFENITLYDSEQISSGIGLMVLAAAHSAKNGASKEEVIEVLDGLKRQIHSDFIVNSTRMLSYAGKLSPRIQAICDALLLHPIIGMKKKKMTVRGIMFGDYEYVSRGYIHKMLKNRKIVNTKILFIVYVGMDEQRVLRIKELVEECCTFERVYLQKASSAITINAGPGAFGLMFLKKDNAMQD